jgi:F0F1-type ATP synthase membrane subunit a
VPVMFLTVIVVTLVYLVLTSAGFAVRPNCKQVVSGIVLVTRRRSIQSQHGSEADIIHTSCFSITISIRFCLISFTMLSLALATAVVVPTNQQTAVRTC